MINSVLNNMTLQSTFRFCIAKWAQLHKVCFGQQTHGSIRFSAISVLTLTLLTFSSTWICVNPIHASNQPAKISLPTDLIANASSEKTINPRTVIFPSDLPMGTLYVRNQRTTNNGAWHKQGEVQDDVTVFFNTPWGLMNNNDWQRLGVAQGSIAVTTGMELMLQVDLFAVGNLSPLARFGQNDLQYLDLTYLIDDKQLIHLKNLTGLKGLNFHNTNLTDTGLFHLKALTGIEELDLSKTYISDAGLAYLSELTNLKILNLADTHNINGVGLTHLTEHTALTILDLPHTIEDEGLAHLAKLTALRELNLRDTKISNEGLAHLSKLTSLEILDLGNTRISRAGLAHLTTLTNLRSLNLYGTPIGINDTELAYLKKLTSLQVLVLPPPARPDPSTVALPPARKTDMPTARTSFSTAVVNGKIYAIGGGPYEAVVLGTVEMYDPVTETWTQKTDMPTARYGLSTAVVNGKIYAIGGRHFNYGDTPEEMSTVEMYDPVTDTWTRKTDMPTARHGLSTAVVDGKIYAIGGTQGIPNRQMTMLKTVEAYDPVTDVWMEKASLLSPRAQLATSVVNGKIYAIGGWRIGHPLLKRRQFGFATLPAVEVYDPVTDTWAKKPNMSIPRAGLSTSVVNGRIYAIGGYLVDNALLPTVEAYDPMSDTWDRTADIQIPRSAHTSNAVNGQIYIIGGGSSHQTQALFGDWTPIPTIEVYNPMTGK